MLGGGRRLPRAAQQMGDGFECHARRFRVQTRVTRAIREILRSKLLGEGMINVIK